MKKKYLSALLFGAMTVVSTGTFTSCSDYDAELDAMQEQIDEVKGVMGQLQTAMNEGGVIKSVTPTAKGVIVELSNGKTFELSNGVDGKDGKPGTVWEITEDGYWACNGEKTDRKAQGEKGDKGEQGEAGVGAGTTVFFEPGTEGAEKGLWVKVTVKDGKETREITADKWESQNGGVIAFYEDGTLKLQNVAGTNGQTVTLTENTLRSLVFVPEFVIDGHEAMEYTYVPYWNHVQGSKVTDGKIITWDARGCSALEVSPKYVTEKEYNPEKRKFIYPYLNKAYHMNPANAYPSVRVQEEGGIGMSSEDLEFINSNTIPGGVGRGYNWANISGNYAAAQPKGKFVKVEKGDMIIGISMQGDKIAKQSISAPEFAPAGTFESVSGMLGKVTMLASSALETKDDSITSDYAAVLGSQLAVTNLAYNFEGTKNNKLQKFQFGFEKDFWTGKMVKDVNGKMVSKKDFFPTTYTNLKGDGHLDAKFTEHIGPAYEEGGYHLYGTMKEAAEFPATIEIAYNNEKGIQLNKLVEAHMLSNSDRSWNAEHKIYANHDIDSLAYYGLEFDFELVHFSVGENETPQEYFAQIKAEDKEANRFYTIYPNAIKSKSDTGNKPEKDWERGEIGKGVEGIGATPMVRVLLRKIDGKHTGDIVKVGYIKFEIIDKPFSEVAAHTYDFGSFYYNCDQVKSTLNWATIREHMIGNMSDVFKTKNEFDRRFRIAQENGEVIPFVPTKEVDRYGNIVYAPIAKADRIGKIIYNEELGSETTSVFTWSVSAADMEKAIKGSDKFVANKEVKVLVKCVPLSESMGTAGDENYSLQTFYMPMRMDVNYPKAAMDIAAVTGKITKYWYPDNNMKIELAKNNFSDFDHIHLHVATPDTKVNDTWSKAQTPAIKGDLNSVFEQHKSLFDFWENGGFGTSYVHEENCPTFNLVKGFDKANFASFNREKLTYRYYFAQENNGKKIEVDGVTYTLLVRNTKDNAQIMQKDANSEYEYQNTQLYAKCGANEELIATIEHRVNRGNVNDFNDNRMFTASLNLNNESEYAKILLNKPASYNGKVNSANGLMGAEEMLKNSLDVQIGVVAFNSCDQNLYLVDNEFGAEILKPVYFLPEDKVEFVDSEDGIQFAYLFDMVKAYDWRVYQFKDSKADHRGLWYYYYYGFKSMTVNPADVRSDYDGEMKELSKLGQDVAMRYEAFQQVPKAEGGTTWKWVEQENPAETEFKVVGEWETEGQDAVEKLQRHFGRLVWNDNRWTVTKDVNLEIPVTIKHFWGEETITVSGVIHKTVGNTLD